MQSTFMDTLQRLVQTLAFSLVISALLYVLQPNHAYEIQLIYSLCIGVSIWAMIDLGRHWMWPDPETGWPKGTTGLLLVLVGVVGGFLVGTALGDTWFGWSSWDRSPAQQRGTWAVSAIAGIVASYYFYTRGKSAHLQTRMVAAQRQATESRLKLLESQLEPHMLFNTLANLRVLIALDPARAQTMLDHLIAYLRATLSASRVDPSSPAGTHTLEHEFDRLRDYLELMAVRMGPRLRYTLDLPAALRQHPVPALLLQPLVENSIQHGLEPKVEGGSIEVLARSDGHTITLQVRDTGLGLRAAQGATDSGGPPQHSSSGRGFGLTQVRERLATLYGANSAMYLIATNEGGTAASVTFPCQL